MDYYATIGPACADKWILQKMIQEGMTGIRMNLSHGDLKEKEEWIETIHNAEYAEGICLKFMIDLQGPELRIGKLRKPLILKKGCFYELKEEGILLPEEIVEQISENTVLLLDDGKIHMKIVELSKNSIKCISMVDSVLDSNKSVAIQDMHINGPALTAHDVKNIKEINQYGITEVMQPFVRTADDLMMLKKELVKAGAGQTRIFAKIENLDGLHKCEEMVGLADCMVIARGDLGNAMPLYKLPYVQKELSKYFKKSHQQFMVVTQMLDSMRSQIIPTRAEVNDIFNAVLDGADSIMLTGETAAGKYPVEAMHYLVKTAEEAKKYIKKHVDNVSDVC